MPNPEENTDESKTQESNPQEVSASEANAPESHPQEAKTEESNPQPLQALTFCEERGAFLREHLNRQKEIHVVGLGLFGGNLSLIQYLAAKGKRIILWEKKGPQDLSASWTKLSSYHDQITCHWECEAMNLPKNELIFLSPAVPPSSEALVGIDSKNISSEIEISMLLLAKGHSRAHFVTGSVGKSTCATLWARALGVDVFGNIGKSLLDTMKPEQRKLPKECIVEISSFQLHYLKWAKVTPSSFLLTPVSDHHGDWHGGVEAYQAIKYDAVKAWREQGIPGFITEKDQALSEGEDDIIIPAECMLLGGHNLENANAVREVCKRIERWSPTARQAICSFPGLEHRLEVCSNDAFDRRYINDSKATSPGAVIEALKSIRTPCALILQGQCQAIDYIPLLRFAQEKNSQIFLVGGMQKLHGLIESDKGFMTCYEDLASLFEDFYPTASGDILFSPGAPSYDQYNNYEERGDHFKALVQDFLGEAPEL
ncbi:MAG: hypothetical protein HQL32_08100 [Planctomycetes bacterium]|nr:hypothetical protein [Planctomycetota bacterium]